jgi:hypothetical protein
MNVKHVLDLSKFLLLILSFYKVKILFSPIN